MTRYLFADLFLTLLLLLLSPLLLFQSLETRRRVLTLPEPPGDLLGSAGEGERLSLLVLGDSAGAGVGAPTQAWGLGGRLVQRLQADYQVNWEFAAKTGYTTVDTIKSLEKVSTTRPDLVVVSLGVNDVTEWVMVNRWLTQQEALVEKLLVEVEAKRVSLSTLRPVHRFPLLPEPLRTIVGLKCRLFSLALKARFASEARIGVSGFHQPFGPGLMSMDGFHPGPIVYEMWAEEILKDNPDL